MESSLLDEGGRTTRGEASPVITSLDRLGFSQPTIDAKSDL